MSWQDVPTVELHEHFIGSMHPELVESMLARKLSEGKITRQQMDEIEDRLFLRGEDGRISYSFDSLEDFMEKYHLLYPCAETPEDYYDIAYDYAKRAAAEGGVFGEIMISPFQMSRVKDADGADLGGYRIDRAQYRRYLDRLEDAVRDAKADFGFDLRYSATITRDYGGGPALAVAKLASDAETASPTVISFGVAGNEEKDFPEVAQAFRIAGTSGLTLRGHAGEICGPDSIRTALDDYKVDYIDHGIAAIEDPGLMQELADRQVLLTVCPTSNGFIIPRFAGAKIAEHPVRALYDAGIPINVSADDAGLFDTSIRQEYRLLQETFGFSDAELYDVTLSSLQHGLQAKHAQTLRAALTEKVLAGMPEAVQAEMTAMAADPARPKAMRNRLQGWLDRIAPSSAPATPEMRQSGSTPRRRAAMGA